MVNKDEYIIVTQGHLAPTFDRNGLRLRGALTARATHLKHKRTRERRWSFYVLYKLLTS